LQTALFIEQMLNGLQLGVMLFLMAAGLTLIFGVMGLINLAHGSLYMVGAFACASVAALTGSFSPPASPPRPPPARWSRSWSCAGSTSATISIRYWRPSR
jgi:branched-subunit amino acid ABC-type transport system permease component